MPVILDGGGSGSLTEVGVGAGVAAHVQVKPLAYDRADSFSGAFRTAGRMNIAAGTAADAVLLELRNPGPLIVVVTRFRISMLATGNQAANALMRFKYTRANSAGKGNGGQVQRTNIIPKRTYETPESNLNQKSNVTLQIASTTGITYGGSASVGVRSTLSYLEFWTHATLPTADIDRVETDFADDVNGTGPQVLAPSDLVIIQNDILAPVTCNVSMAYDISWTETSAF